MKQTFTFSGFLSLLVLFLFSSCQKDIDTLPLPATAQLKLPATPYNYADPDMRESLKPLFTSALSGVTDDGATLGRVLFYDTKLSFNNKVSCGSCHHQEKAFCDPVQFSTGINGQKTTRNTPPIMNVGLSNKFFWDQRADNLEDMVLMPVRNHIEMGLERMDYLEAKLGVVDYYRPLFENAFGSPEVTEERIADALAQFLRSMVSVHAKSDDHFDELGEQEREGFEIFWGEGRCANCHNGVNFSGGWSHTDQANIGLEMEYTDKGMGEFAVDMEGVFKVPSLRNVALTAPYMHDGRFKTLEEVVEHYSSGIQNHPNLDFRLRDWNSETLQLNLSEEEKAALVAFLHTLTDEEFITAKRFSNPF